MLKLNLLPPSYLARKKIAIAWTIVAALIAVEITGVVFGRMALSQQVASLEPTVTAKEQAVQQVQTLKSEADTITQEAGIYEPTLKTMQELKEYNQVRPALYQRTARYVYRNATTMSMGSTAGYLQLQMYVSNINDLSRAYLYLWSDPDFSSVTLSGVPVFRTRTRRSDDQNLPPSFIPGFDPGMASASPFGMPGSPYGAGAFGAPGDPYATGGMGGPAFGAPGGSGAPAPYGAPYGDPGMAGGATPFGAPYGAPGMGGPGMPGDPSMMAGPGMPGAPPGMGGEAGMMPGGYPGPGGPGMSGDPNMMAGAGMPGAPVSPYGAPGMPGDPSMMAGGMPGMPGMPGMDALGGDPNAQQGGGLVPGIAPWRLPVGTYPVGATVVFTCVLKKPIRRPAVIPGGVAAGAGMGQPGMPGMPGMDPSMMGTPGMPGMDPAMGGPGMPVAPGMPAGSGAPAPPGDMGTPGAVPPPGP